MPGQDGGTSGNETQNAVGGSEGITVAQAAASLGVSARAIRARLQRGTLDGYQVPGPRGEEWRVLGVSARIPTYEPEGHTGKQGNATEHGTAARAWVAERAALLAQVEWLRGQVEARTAAEGELRQLLAQAQQQNAALSSRLESLAARAGGSDPTERNAEREPASSAGGEHHGREQDGAEQQQRRRPWWKVWGQGV